MYLRIVSVSVYLQTRLGSRAEPMRLRTPNGPRAAALGGTKSYFVVSDETKRKEEKKRRNRKYLRAARGPAAEPRGRARAPAYSPRMGANHRWLACVCVCVSVCVSLCVCVSVSVFGAEDWGVMHCLPGR